MEIDQQDQIEMIDYYLDHDEVMQYLYADRMIDIDETMGKLFPLQATGLDTESSPLCAILSDDLLMNTINQQVQNQQGKVVLPKTLEKKNPDIFSQEFSQ